MGEGERERKKDEKGRQSESGERDTVMQNMAVIPLLLCRLIQLNYFS